MSGEKDYDIVVIGGGSAGLVVAAGAAHLGARVMLIEKRALGGDCLYTGCVPSKSFIASARLAARMRRAAEMGFAPVEPKFLNDDFASVAARVQRVIETVAERDAPDVFRALGVEIVFGSPRFVSPREVEIVDTETGDGSKRRVRARRFCISTGSRPAAPPVEGLNDAEYVTNEEVFRLKKLPSSLIVLGGGPIGLELGQSFARFGSDVTIVEMDSRLLAREDEEASAAIESALRSEGVKIHLNAKAVRAVKAEGRKTITIERNGEESDLQAEEILVATGRRPNIEGLNLEAAGVRFDDKRIETDDYLRTSASHIYASGDVTGRYPFTHMAAYEASVVVRNALFFWPLRQKTDYRVTPWTTFTDPEIARVGLTEKEAAEKFGVDAFEIFRTDFAENDRAQAEGETHGFAKIIAAGRRREIVGAHIVGAHAGELLHEVIFAMKKRLSVESLASLIHVYPTLTQVNQKAGLDAVLSKIASYEKILSYYFKLRR